MEPARLGRFAAMLKQWAFTNRVSAQELAHGMSVLSAAVALGLGVDRQAFMSGAGDAYDEAQKNARAGLSGILVRPDGSPLG